MIYTKQEKQKLKRVIAVFAERLKESDAFDLVWSDKVGYVLLDMYDLENIQAFVIANGAEHTIRDYAVSIYKDKENGGLEVGVTGHLFGND